MKPSAEQVETAKALNESTCVPCDCGVCVNNIAEYLAARDARIRAEAFDEAADLARDLHSGEECMWSGEDSLRSKAAKLRQEAGL